METTELFRMLSDNQSALDVNRNSVHSFDIPENIDAFRVSMAVLHLVVCVVGLGGNLLVVVAILKLDKMASATTVYIFNLALADGLFMVGLTFVAFQNFHNEWIFGDLACKLVMVLDGINQFTSVFCLTVMSVDRYMALVDPLRFARWRTPKRAKIISAFLWLFSLIPVLPMALHFTVQYGLCMADMFVEKWWMTFLTYTFVLGFVLPFLLMIIFYTSLVVALRSSRQRGRNSTSPESQRLEKQVTKMVVAVIVVFGICWLPFYIFNFCSLYGTNTTLAFARGFEIAVLLSYSWSCANPILYACLSETFGRYFRTLLCPHKNSPSMHCNRETEGYDLPYTNAQDVSVPT
ncbi:somatostatin receptor type 5 [Trichomycterus rosablanca]|uniref:somatostatin receptor type 5 n=1 Tax=Trichomycterus rosablanca TaxID=2290929 RepID=UPI002F357390